MDNWKKSGRKRGDPPPEEPEERLAKRFHTSDVTVEALAVLLEQEPRGLLVWRDELSGWINGFDAYKSARGADVAHWLSMHRAGALTVDRKSGAKKVIHIARASVSLAGGIQLGALKAALAGRYDASGSETMTKPPREHFENGLTARLLFSCPPRRTKVWTEADVGAETMSTVEEIFTRLFALDFRRDDNNELQPIDLPLAPRAKEMWIEFYNEHARELCDLSEDLAAAWSKLEGYAARFALLFHLVRVAANDSTLIDSVAIDHDSMRAGISVSRWFGDEASRIYSLLGAEGDLAEDVERRRLMRVVRDHSGEISSRGLMRASRKYRANVETAEAALNGLVQEGIGQWVSKPSGEHGGRPARVFRLMEQCGPEGDKTIECEALSEVVSPSPLIGESQDTLLEHDSVEEGRDNASEIVGKTPDDDDGNTTPNNVESSEVSSPLANGELAADPFEEFEL